MQDLSLLKEGEEIMDMGVYSTRPLEEYPTVDFIASFLSKNGNLKRRIYTENLNVNGIAVQDSMEKYLEKDAYQSSHFKQALISPLHLKFSLDDDKKELEKLRKTPNHFNIGTYLHQCILEPSKFNRTIVEPNHSLASKEGVEALIKFWENTIEEKGYFINEFGEEININIIKELALKKVTDLELDVEKQDGKKTYYHALKKLSCFEAVSEENNLKIKILKKYYDEYAGGVLTKLLSHSKREISFYTEIDGLKVKCRPDAIQFKENIGVDAIISIKSTSKEDLRRFYIDAANLNYDLTEGMYQEIVSKVTGRDFNTTIMVMLQTVPPFGVAVLVWSAEDIEMGKYKFRSALEIAKQCKETGKYSGYESFAEYGNMGLISMSLPSWNNRDILPNNI